MVSSNRCTIHRDDNMTIFSYLGKHQANIRFALLQSGIDNDAVLKHFYRLLFSNQLIVDKLN